MGRPEVVIGRTHVELLQALDDSLRKKLSINVSLGLVILVLVTWWSVGLYMFQQQ